MRVVLYARVSSDKQDTNLSVSAQLRALREHAHTHGWEVVREFVDEAKSGRTADRPAFREMISLAKLKAPPFEAILIWKLNRFSRSRADSITYKTLLRGKGIEVISINEPVDENTHWSAYRGCHRIHRRVLQRESGSGHKEGHAGKRGTRFLQWEQASVWLPESCSQRRGQGQTPTGARA